MTQHNTVKAQYKQQDPEVQKGNNPTPPGEKNEPSKPKDPNNDPDQTPDREVEKPPQADPRDPTKNGGKEPYK